MELTGQHKIPAPRQAVWEGLNDPELLKECIKGCQRLEKVDDHTMTATVQAKVGPVKATFDAKVEIVDPQPPERYTLTGEGKGGVAGFAKGSADVVLTEDGAETLLDYTAKATVGGKLAQLGSRLVDTTAKKYAADFFEVFCARMAERAGGAAPATEPEAATPEGPNETLIDEGLGEEELALKNPAIDSPHIEDTIEDRIEGAAAKGSWGGTLMWGMLAFAVVILILIALQ